jgi:hypothetical protein
MSARRTPLAHGIDELAAKFIGRAPFAIVLPAMSKARSIELAD